MIELEPSENANNEIFMKAKTAVAGIPISTTAVFIFICTGLSLYIYFRATKDRYLFRCRSASFFRRTRTAQSGQYLARLDFGVNTAPHSTQRFTSSRLLLISAHRAASSSELAMAKSVRKNAQPQIENLCSKGAWGTSLNKRVWLSG